MPLRVEKESEWGPHLFYYVRGSAHQGLAALAYYMKCLL